MPATNEEQRDYFISFTQADLDVATWIAEALKAAGRTLYFQPWDFDPGSRLMQNMRDAARRSRHTLAVVSHRYLASEFARHEFDDVLSLSVRENRTRLIPIRVDDCRPEALASDLVYIDLSKADLSSAAARAAQTRSLLDGLKIRPRKAAAEAPPVNYARLAFDQPLGGDDELFSVAFSRGSRWIAAGSAGKVLLWDRARLSEPIVLEGPTSYVYSVAFSHDGRHLASGCEDRIVRVWDLATRELLWKDVEGQPPQHDDAVYSVAFSPDGSQVVSGGYDGRIALWDTASGRVLSGGSRSLDGMGRVSSVAFAPAGGERIAIGSHDNQVRLWNPGNGGVKVLRGHRSSVEAVAFSHDGSRLASCGLDKTVRVWNVENGKPIWCRGEHEYLVRSVAFSPDGHTVASASWDKTLRLWDAGTGRELGRLPFDRDKKTPWHSDWIWSVAFEPEGTMLATGGSDGKLLLWMVAQPRA